MVHEYSPKRTFDKHGMYASWLQGKQKKKQFGQTEKIDSHKNKTVKIGASLWFEEAMWTYWFVWPFYRRLFEQVVDHTDSIDLVGVCIPYRPTAFDDHLQYLNQMDHYRIRLWIHPMNISNTWAPMLKKKNDINACVSTV